MAQFVQTQLTMLCRFLSDHLMDKMNQLYPKQQFANELDTSFLSPSISFPIQIGVKKPSFLFIVLDQFERRVSETKTCFAVVFQAL